MRISLRDGFYVGLGLALLVGLFAIWLWQPERQVSRHAENLLGKIGERNWTAAADFIGDDYNDQWGEDRSLVIARLREVFRYVRDLRINAADPVVSIKDRRGIWRGKITIQGDNSEVSLFLKERVNSLATPFELEWRQLSVKPWDWKLVRVSNPDLEIPAGLE